MARKALTPREKRTSIVWPPHWHGQVYSTDCSNDLANLDTSGKKKY